MVNKLSKDVRRYAGDTLALAALLVMCAKALLGFDQSWDALAYHLPFAALRAGVVAPGEFVLWPGLANRYLGFPALIDLVQGGLWRLSGTATATALIAPLAIAVMALYMRAAFRLGTIWTVMVFLAVPILHTALDSAYVDLWTNAFFALHLVAAWRSLGGGQRHMVISLLALALAVNSKQQFYVVGAVSFGLYLGLLIAAKRPKRQILAALLLMPLVFFAPLRNVLLHRNPVFPLAVPSLGLRGPEVSPLGTGETPTRLPQFLRYVVSQLEVDALSGRTHGYTIDQGEVTNATAFHRGGSLALLLFAGVVTVILCLRRLETTRVQKLSFGAFGVMVGVVANFPGSNELRYFSFVEIVVLLAALCLCRWLAERDDGYAKGLQSGFRAALMGAVLFTSAVTGFVHIVPHREGMARVVAKHREIEPELDGALAGAKTICYARLDANGILYAHVFHSEKPDYSVVEATDPAACPAGSGIIR